MIAVVGLCGVIVLGRRGRGTRTQPAAGQGAGGMFGRGHWLIVAAEAVLLFGGIALLRSWDAPEQANVAWIAVVVGVHFIVLAPIWKQTSILVPGVILTLLGVAGLVMANTSAVAWVPIVSGVLSGLTLLVGCVCAAWLGMSRATPKGLTHQA
ncbi:hypothetical protein [Microbispora sp. NPDC049125]|uniref:hypothetical protein n=1 Tax=Microbispora sp. NPDC049125 TaxID=3154929 RepID=UPI003466A7BA